MKRVSTLLVLLLFCWCGRAPGQELVHFPSLDPAAPLLDGYLFRPSGGGTHPAIAVLPGCSGMLGRMGTILPLYLQWAGEFSRHAWVVLEVDSLGPRRHGEMCSISGFDLAIYRARPRDAYGALWYLQKQPFIRGDRIAIAGWSQGGGVTLLAIGAQDSARPASLPQGDFRAAVAFYPGGCDVRRHPADWTTSIPLLTLLGAADVWTPMAPCQEFLNGARSRGANVDLQIYPGAYHAFDAPDRARTELPQYTTRAGVVPIVGTDPTARQDALVRVPAFLARYLDQ